MTEEIWKDITGYEGQYQISSEGRVKSLARKFIDKAGHPHTIKECFMKTTPDKDGYKIIGLRDGSGSQKKFRLHRLVCEAFHPNPDNKPQVNHIDEDKSNNKASNLEWSTAKENCNHGTRNARGAKANSKPVAQYALDGKLIRIYESASEAGKQTGVDRASIGEVALGKRKTAGNCIWKYISDEEEACNLELTAKELSRAVSKDRDYSKPVAQYTLDNELVKTWKSPIEAERETGFNNVGISAAALGKQKTHRGYIWKYVSDEDGVSKLDLSISKDLCGVTKGKTCSRPVAQYTLDGELIKIFQSAREAEKLKGFNHSAISAVALGKQKTHKGYIWKYVSQ